MKKYFLSKPSFHLSTGGEDVIKRINNKIKKKTDILYILGNLSSTSVESLNFLLRQINCIKILVPCLNDMEHKDEYSDFIHVENYIVEEKISYSSNFLNIDTNSFIKEIDIYLSFYPFFLTSTGSRKSINIFGQPGIPSFGYSHPLNKENKYNFLCDENYIIENYHVKEIPF